MGEIIAYLYELIDKSGAVDNDLNVDESVAVKVGDHEVTVGDLYRAISVLEDAE